MVSLDISRVEYMASSHIGLLLLWFLEMDDVGSLSSLIRLEFRQTRTRIPVMSLTRAMWMSGRDVPRDRRTFVPVQTRFRNRLDAKPRRIRSRSAFATSYLYNMHMPVLVKRHIWIFTVKKRKIPKVFLAREKIWFLFVEVFEYEFYLPIDWFQFDVCIKRRLTKIFEHMRTPSMNTIGGTWNVLKFR